MNIKVALPKCEEKESHRRKSVNLFAAVSHLPNCERHIAVLDHVLNLTSHRHNEQDNPVHDQHRPEHWNIEDGKPRADKGNRNGTGGSMPKLEFGQTANEGTELVILLCRKAGRGITVFHALILSERGIEFGLQKRQEKIQKVDAKRIRHNVPSLGQNDSQEKEEKKCTGAGPPVGCEGGRSIKVRLILPGKFRGLRRDCHVRRLFRLRDIHNRRHDGKSIKGE